MLSSSGQLMTARSSTLQNKAILRFSSSGNMSFKRHTKMSGCKPIERISLTECWVGLVLISPAASM